MTNLQEALKALNRVIHDLRLAETHTSCRFLIQPPSRVSSDAKISLILDSRPVVTDRARVSDDPENAGMASSFALQMGSGILNAAETLMGLGKDLRMRINFGRFNVRQKKKGTGSEFTYAEFADIMEPYAVRGARAAGLGTK